MGAKLKEKPRTSINGVELVTIAEAAQFARVSPGTIYNRFKDGTLTKYTIWGEPRIKASDLLGAVKAETPESGQTPDTGVNSVSLSD